MGTPALARLERETSGDPAQQEVVLSWRPSPEGLCGWILSCSLLDRDRGLEGRHCNKTVIEAFDPVLSWE